LDAVRHWHDNVERRSVRPNIGAQSRAG
jgi:hypothetical protein